jgi:hypothetical protein
MTTGSRFTGGYQFPATDHAALKRHPPVKTAGPIGPHAAHVELIPLTGSDHHAEIYDIAMTWIDHGPNGRTQGQMTYLVRGTDNAHQAFEEVCRGWEDETFPAHLDHL